MHWSGWVDLSMVRHEIVSYSNSGYSMFASNNSRAYSISWEKSCPYEGSPCLANASSSEESTTCMGIASSIYMWSAPYWICCRFISFLCWCNSCSFQSFSLSSYSSFSISPILFFYLYLHAIRLSHCYFFAWIASVACSTSGSTWNFHICSSSMRSTIFLFPLSCRVMLSSGAYVVFATAGISCDAASCYCANHSIANPTYSLGLEEL